MIGRVCAIHGEWSATGICRWCEEPPHEAIFLSPSGVVFSVPAEPFRSWPYKRALALRDQLRAPPSWRLDYEDPACVVELNAAEQSRLDVQHAALRWERVARRWNYKHRKMDGLDEAGRAYVWRSWLSQVDRIYRAALREEPP